MLFIQIFYVLKIIENEEVTLILKNTFISETVHDFIIMKTHIFEMKGKDIKCICLYITI